MEVCLLWMKPVDIFYFTVGEARKFLELVMKVGLGLLKVLSHSPYHDLGEGKSDRILH